MYATHFDLNGRLFAPGIAQDDARFVDEREVDAGLPAAVALSAPDSVLVLLGQPGVGKTAFAANALRTSTGGMRCAVAWIATPPASPHELLELLLAEYGFEPYRQSRAERLQTWRQFLVELGATATRVFVAIERAHDFELPVLSALDALTTADPNACPGASLVLMGTDELASRLEEPSLEPLRQRVRLVRRLAPLDAPGVERYLRHAAGRAGGTLERLFTADALAAITRHSRGIPRIVNHLAEGALALATLRGTALVDAAIVSVVAAERAGSALPSRGTGSTLAAERAGSTLPIEPAGSTLPAEPAASTLPAEPAASTLPAGPAPSTLPAEPAASTLPAEPAGSASLIEPAESSVTAEPRTAAAEPPAGSPAAPTSAPLASRSPTTPPAPAAVDDIPVLTECVDGAADGELDPLDGAATMTLLGDDLDNLSAEIAAEMLASDAADAPDSDAEDPPGARRRGKPRRRAAG